MPHNTTVLASICMGKGTTPRAPSTADGVRWFRGDVIHYAVDAAHLIDDVLHRYTEK